MVFRTIFFSATEQKKARDFLFVKLGKEIVVLRKINPTFIITLATRHFYG